MAPHRALALVALASLMACTASAPGGPVGDASPTGDTGSGVSCAELCTRVIVTPGCTTDPSACRSLCETGLALVPARCRAQYDALMVCARTSAIECASATQVRFPGCATPQAAFAACASAPDDGGA